LLLGMALGVESRWCGPSSPVAADLSNAGRCQDAAGNVEIRDIAQNKRTLPALPWPEKMRSAVTQAEGQNEK
jgi:hypothetical protein